MVGQIYALSKYQQGCRFLQKKLDENIPENTRTILNELINHLGELMTGKEFIIYVYYRIFMEYNRSIWQLFIQQADGAL